MIVKLGNQKANFKKAGMYTTDCTLIPGRQTAQYISYQGVLLQQTRTLKPNINTVLFYIYFKACSINDIKIIYCLK